MCSALVLCVIIAPLLGTAEAEAARPEITAVVAGVVDRQVTLIIDLPGVAQQPLPPESFSAKVHGSPQGGQVGPVLSDELAVSFVIDASESGLPVFPDGARGVGNFLLAQPSVDPQCPRRGRRPAGGRGAAAAGARRRRCAR